MCCNVSELLSVYKQLCGAMSERHSHALHSINSLKAICDKLSVKWDQNQLELIRANETICDHSLQKCDKLVQQIKQQINDININVDNNDCMQTTSNQSSLRQENIFNSCDDNSSYSSNSYTDANKYIGNNAEIISVNKNDFVVCSEEFILPLDEDVLEHQLNACEIQKHVQNSNNKYFDKFNAIEKCMVKKEPIDGNDSVILVNNERSNQQKQETREHVERVEHIEQRLIKRKLGNTLQCSECKQKFRKDYLPVHMRIHTGERPFKCEYGDCDKTFSQTSSRNMHYRTHSGVKPYACDTVADCGRKFTKRCDLIKHVSSHFVYQPENIERQRVYKCRYPNCGKSFGLVCVLQRHEVIHTGVKQFRCNSVGCKYESFWKENLREHYKRRHHQVFIS